MHRLIEASYRDLDITQDLGAGMMLWMCHHFPDELVRHYVSNLALPHRPAALAHRPVLF